MILKAPDYAKAFGIILVVSGHTLRGLIASGILQGTELWATIYRMIYLFHMPLFFYLSGLFFESSVKRVGTVPFIKKNAFHLLMPLVIWSYIQFSLQYIASDSVNEKLTFFDVLTAPFPPREQFWFLGALFTIMILTAFIYNIKQSHLFLWIITLLLFSVIVHTQMCDLTFKIGQSFFTFLGAQIFINTPYFMLGILINTQKVMSWRISNGICILLFALSLYASENINIYNNLIHLVTSISCILLVYKFMCNCDVSSRNNATSALARTAAFIGVNSMIIYLAHVIVTATYRTFLLKLHIDNPFLHLAGAILLGITIPLALVPFGIKLAQYYPQVAQAILPVRYSRHSAK